MWISRFFCTLPIAPVAMGRPRFNRLTGRTYTPQKSANALSKIKIAIQKQMIADKTIKIPPKTPVFVQLVFVHRRPKNHKKTDDRSPKTTKPDIDNLAKSYLDGLTKGGLWHDDNQITSLHCEDLYGATDEDPHVIINVSVWSNQPNADISWLHHSQI